MLNILFNENTGTATRSLKETHVRPGQHASSTAPSVVPGKEKEKLAERKPPFNHNARPPQRFAEQPNYTTTHHKPQMIISLMLPIFTLLIVLFTCALFAARLSARVFVMESSNQQTTTANAQWYQVFRIASGEEVQNGSLVEFEYPQCGIEVKVGCWMPLNDSIPSLNLTAEVEAATFIRNVFAYVEPDQSVACPPSLFFGNSPISDQNCSEFD